MNGKLYQEIAIACGARKRCIASGNKFAVKWDERIAQLNDALPSGSGIDCGSKIDVDASGDEKVVIDTSYHHMNDGGYYSGWTEHVVTLTPSFSSFHLKISGPDRNQIKDYLSEVFSVDLDRPAPAYVVATVATESVAELRRLKAYFPYRIIFAAMDPITGAVETFAMHTKREMNKQNRAGKLIFTLA